MRAAGVRGLLIYCSDYKCNHSTAPFVNCFTYAERGLIYQAPVRNGHWRSQNGCYFEFSFPRNRTQSRQRNGPNHHHLLRNRIAPSVTLPNPALNLSESPPAHASLHRADALGATAEVRLSPLNRPDYPAAGDLMPHRATRRKKPIPKSLINSDQHPERQVYHA